MGGAYYVRTQKGKRETISLMNSNLSSSQFEGQSSLTKMGAMPNNPKFDGPSALKPPKQDGANLPNGNVPLAKPGFF